MEFSREACRYLKRRLRVFRGVDIISKVELNCQREKHGKGYGEWTICPVGVDSNSIIYSIGVGGDISFDLSLINKYNLSIHAFDPTPQVIDWVRSQQHLTDHFIFHEYGIESYDGDADFQPISAKHEPSSSSHSTCVKPETRGYSIKVPMKTLKSVTQALGHSRIDILKMDIEGSEWSVIPSIIYSNIEIYQILIEFHHLEFRNVGTKATKECLNLLAEKQYKVFALSATGQEYSFIRQDILNRITGKQ